MGREGSSDANGREEDTIMLESKTDVQDKVKLEGLLMQGLTG